MTYIEEGWGNLDASILIQGWFLLMDGNGLLHLSLKVSVFFS